MTLCGKGKQYRNSEDESKPKHFSKSDSILPHKKLTDHVRVSDKNKNFIEPLHHVAHDSVISNGVKEVSNNLRTTKYQSRHTYSAQYPSQNQIINRSRNVMPLYNVFSNVTATCQSQNIPQNLSTRRPPTCQCSNLPPPPCTINNDNLWDLQFCRWWGWNWVRKREELLNKQKTAMDRDRSRKRNCNCLYHNPPPCKPCKNRGKCFKSWYKKLFKRKQVKKLLREEEKDQLQRLYDTPCSSVMFEDCHCPLQDSCSINLDGEYECHCSSARQTSTSTVVIRNQSRRKACKYNARKRQSWMCQKSESSSSDECQPRISTSRRACHSSTEESVEYLSLRMECIKSDCELDTVRGRRCCPKNICGRKENLCKIRQGCYKKPNNCSFYYRKPEFAQKMKILPCRNICKNSTPPRIPRFRRQEPGCIYVTSRSDFRQPLKRNVSCICEKNIFLSHQLPYKKFRICKKPKKVYLCCCCCCCGCSCHCFCNGSNLKPDSIQNGSKNTVNKSTNVPSAAIKDSIDVYNGPANVANPNSNIYPIPILCNGLLGNSSYNQHALPVTKAVETGLYSSPVTGKTYPLAPKIFVPGSVLPSNNLPTPIDANDTTFFVNINPAQSAAVDEEHAALLNAVCEAILSSRCSDRENVATTRISRTCFFNSNAGANDFSQLLQNRSSSELMIYKYDSSSERTGNSANVRDNSKPINNLERKTLIPVRKTQLKEINQHITNAGCDKKSFVKQQGTLSPVQEEKSFRNSEHETFNNELVSEEILENCNTKSNYIKLEMPRFEGLNAKCNVSTANEGNTSDFRNAFFDIANFNKKPNISLTDLLSYTSPKQYSDGGNRLKNDQFYDRLFMQDQTLFNENLPHFLYNLKSLPTTYTKQEQELFVSDINPQTNPVKVTTNSMFMNDKQTLTIQTKDAAVFNNQDYNNCPCIDHNYVSLSDSEKFLSVTQRTSEEETSNLRHIQNNDYNSASETSTINSLLKEPLSKPFELSTIFEENSGLLLKPKIQKSFVETSPFKIQYASARRGDKENLEYQKSKIPKREPPLCSHVPGKRVENCLICPRRSISRPERKMIVTRLQQSKTKPTNKI